MTEAFICDAIRTPIGRYGGVLSGVRTDDLAALPLAALMKRNTGVDWQLVDDVVLGCANQAGEDNRNLARMASLLAGLIGPTAAQLDVERDFQRELGYTDDYAEGVAAFSGKRAPRFVGR